LKEPPETEAERLRMTSTLHALEHASRLVEAVTDCGLEIQTAAAAHNIHVAELCARTMHGAEAVGNSITSETALGAQAAPIGWNVSPEIAAALAEAQNAARDLDAMRREHRAATLASVAPGKLTAADALARIDAVRCLDRIAHHAWHSAAHLLGRDAHDPGASQSALLEGRDEPS
jgi:phosphate:Na+ symporter